MASGSSPSEEHALKPMSNMQEEVVPIPPPGAAAKEKECVHKTKTIQFLGRTLPIVLQNDNGPCPLLAICNVLLLRNNITLSPDIAEVSQERLLSLIAERLIDSNSNTNNKDAGYIQNQQQNVADAIDLLPQLATGIDVNIKFKRIDDFEFTPECAIFDLLDIPLYHGWIVDLEDRDTANAIGSKSYNALMGELVALETQIMEGQSKDKPEEDCIDFAAATTATLGVPSPSLSKARSFNDSPRSVSSLDRVRKGDLEEEAELLRALKLSEVESSHLEANSFVAAAYKGVESVVLDERPYSRREVVDSVDRSEGSDVIDKNQNAVSNEARNGKTSPEDMACSSSKIDLSNHQDQLNIADSGESFACSSASMIRVEMAQTGGAMPPSPATVSSSMDGDTMVIPQGDEKVDNESSLFADICKPLEISSGHRSPKVSGSSAPNQDSDLSNGQVQNTDTPETHTSSVDGSEPIYEGEECILDSVAAVHEDREPMYEGEVILAKQADEIGKSPVEITPQQGELIKNFLKNNANQLTFYGLFCLQEGLKERELCVFFRNNHFSTMFKFDGQLYLLATDQGYINQPDLVWEKLNEVNGDTLFMTSNFKEFKVESHANDTWDENNAIVTTADYLASIDSAAQADLDINSDLQLAIALQQQEFEQRQPQRPNLQQQQNIADGSRLITGPQRPSNSGRTSASHSKTETKPKDKCTVM